MVETLRPNCGGSNFQMFKWGHLRAVEGTLTEGGRLSTIDLLVLICSDQPGNTKGGCIIVPLTSCLTGLDQSVLQIKTEFVSSHTAVSKPVKQEVNSIVILPPLVFPGSAASYIENTIYLCCKAGYIN
jgi:hypothetical protein